MIVEYVRYDLPPDQRAAFEAAFTPPPAQEEDEAAADGARIAPQIAPHGRPIAA